MALGEIRKLNEILQQIIPYHDSNILPPSRSSLQSNFVTVKILKNYG